MARIKKSAVRKYGTEVDTPYEYGGSTYASSIPAYSPETSAYAANDSVAYVNDSVNEYEPVETTIPSYEVYEPIEVTTTSSYEVYEPIEVTATSSYEVYEPVEIATTSSYEEYKPAGTITTSSYDEDGHLVAESEEINTLLASIKAKVSKI